MLNSIYRKLLHKTFAKIEIGTIEIIENFKKPPTNFTFGSKKHTPLTAKIVITNAEFYSRIILGGELGFGESFLDKLWSTNDIEALWLILCLNKHIIEKNSPFISFVNYIFLSNRRDRYLRSNNTIANNQKQISFAYDTGNDFFEKMLGPSMLYSCGMWDSQESTLEDAQKNKLNLITKKLKVHPNHKVLDIGMGWGTLADHLKKEIGCEVNGISLSKEQIDYCNQKYPQINFEYKDYRQAEGSYDRIVSVGMMEHLGLEYLGTYFAIINKLLKPGGRAVLQTMTDRQLLTHNEGKRYVSFSHKYIMPNVVLPTDKTIRDAIFTTKNLQLTHWEDFGPHYGRTGAAWRANLIKHKEEIIRKYSEKLFDIYDYNWAIFSACFSSGICGLVQMVVEKRPLLNNDEIDAPQSLAF